MKFIKLSQNKEAIVSDQDFEWLSQFNWFFDGNYAQRGENYKKVRMHNQIMGNSKGKFVDHINSNKLDNRRENLRIVTIQQNAWNMGKHKDSPIPFKGVYKNGKNWIVRIWKGKWYNFGTYSDMKKAARIYDARAKELFGEYAKLNFA